MRRHSFVATSCQPCATRIYQPQFRPLVGRCDNRLATFAVSIHHCPCLHARDWSCRVSGFVLPQVGREWGNHISNEIKSRPSCLWYVQYWIERMLTVNKYHITINFVVIVNVVAIIASKGRGTRLALSIYTSKKMMLFFKLFHRTNQQINLNHAFRKLCRSQMMTSGARSIVKCILNIVVLASSGNLLNFGDSNSWILNW